MARIYRLSVGDRLTLAIGGQPVDVFVAAIWRDYARHYGALALDLEDYRRRVPGARVSDAALWLEPGASAATVVDHLAMTLPGFARIELSEPGAIREQSLRIFDRSFAITYLLEAVAVVIGLLGVAATFSAEALSRRREFGLQRALGMRRRAIAAQLATEGALFAALGAAVGGTVGFAISLLLVEVINPQSFHWTMDLATPWGLLGILATLLVALAAVTAVVAGRAALTAATVGALREDW
jgi:putative ABC transport system permease protein